MAQFDVLIIGAGTAGMPCAIEAALSRRERSRSEQASEPGGNLACFARSHESRRYKAPANVGLDDREPNCRIERISRGTCRSDLVAQSVLLQGETIDWLLAQGFEMDLACPQVLLPSRSLSDATDLLGDGSRRSILRGAKAPI